MTSRKYCTLPYKEYVVADGNYDTSRSNIDLIVLHHTACTFQQAINTFGSPNAKTSAHYIVSNKGEIAAMLEEYNTAYANGNYAINQRAVSIETEFYEGMGDRTTELYETVSKLVADIAKFYSIPLDTDHVKPHKAFFNTACPGTLDIPRIIDRARAINNSETPLQACLRMRADAVKELADIKKEHDKCSMLSLENSSLKARVLTLEAEIKEKTDRLNLVTSERDRLRDKISKAQVALS